MLQTVLEVASGLEYLHAPGRRVVHRDLSAGNVLLASARRGGGDAAPGPAGMRPASTRPFRAVISDFGLSMMLSVAATHRTSHMKGTVAYMSPEVFRTSDVTPALDIYSLGIISEGLVETGGGGGKGFLLLMFQGGMGCQRNEQPSGPGCADGSPPSRPACVCTSWCRRKCAVPATPHPTPALPHAVYYVYMGSLPYPDRNPGQVGLVAGPWSAWQGGCTRWDDEAESPPGPGETAHSPDCLNC